MVTSFLRKLNGLTGRIAGFGVVLLLNVGPTAAQSDGFSMKSPNLSYEVRFSDPRSDAASSGRLWGKIAIRDLKTGRERTARVASGQRGHGNFEGFSVYEQQSPWSPDGLFLAFWVDYCQNEPAVSGGDVCHLHEINFLNMRQNDCREGLTLGRYAFAGWAQNKPHTVLEIPMYADSRTDRRSPCAVK